MKKAALVTVHGMGTTPCNYADELTKELRRRLGTLFDDLHIGTVYYQSILQENEERVWDKVAERLKWDELRKFLLFGFADAAGLESGKEQFDSVYAQAQVKVARELYRASVASKPNAPLIIIAQSLGCQVISCYFWDALRAQRGEAVANGIWSDISLYESQISGDAALGPEQISFLQGSSFQHLLTTGCNIPIFVAAHATNKILPIIPNQIFKWDNYYDRDDVLGWPLADLSDEYARVVTDHPVNAGSGVFGWLLKSWNPLSHGQYWGDNEVLDPLEAKLRQVLG
jgi:hypothetical protein